MGDLGGGGRVGAQALVLTVALITTLIVLFSSRI
jgi:hypothetical protein